MATFQLNFTGLCAFSPGAGSKTVVLGNSRDHGGEPHIPVLLADRSSAVINGGARPFDRDRELDSGARYFGYDRMVGWTLAREIQGETKGENLTLSPLVEDFSVAPGPPPDATCPTIDPEGFGWVASMQSAEGAQFDPTVLTTRDTDRVLARCLVDHGRLATAHFAGGPGRPFRWAYLRNGSEQPDHAPRAIAEVAHVTGTFSGDQIRIRSQDFDGSPLADIVLDRQGGPLLTAWLVNMPLADILADRPQDPPAYPHFQHFYRLSDKPGGLRFPHRQGRCNLEVDSFVLRPKGFHAPTNPKCPPVMFES